MKTMFAYLKPLVAAILLLGAVSARAEHHEIAPSTVIHVVTVSWKSDAKPEQIEAALEGVKTLAEEYDGIKRVWIKTIKAQGNRSHAFVMEFASEKALKDYANSPAQKKWYALYQPVREGSTTFDITN